MAHHAYNTIGLTALLLMGSALPVLAEEPPLALPKNTSVIDGNALGNAQGAITVNMAAGDSNVQANAGAIAIGAASLASVNINQQTEIPGGDGAGENHAYIGGNAFQGATGWIAVNQSAGQGNAQANALVINMGVDIDQLDDADLGSVSTEQKTWSGNPDDEDSRNSAKIDPNAFAGSRGVVQVNQAAGSGNATGNRFELRVDSALAP